jgi:light-regulated signal transduction histidine kinase (bacteriophytochrome)
MTKKAFLTSIKTKNSAIKLLNNQSQHVYVYADKGRISQVVSNLLDNAVKFTKAAEGNITIMVKKEGREEVQNNNNNQQQVIVSIKDTGTGIDSEYCQGFLQNSLLNHKQEVQDLDYLYARVLSKLMVEGYGLIIILVVEEGLYLHLAFHLANNNSNHNGIHHLH